MGRHQSAARHCRPSFYEGLNRLLDEHGFDDFVEGLCAKFYADDMGDRARAPGVYFRLLLVGYFEGIGSNVEWPGGQLILWHCGSFWIESDRVATRSLHHLPNPTTAGCGDPRSSLCPGAEADWGQRPAAGKTIGIDATTLEANAALRSIVRRDSEQGDEEFLMELAKASGIETPRTGRSGQTGSQAHG